MYIKNLKLKLFGLNTKKLFEAELGEIEKKEEEGIITINPLYHVFVINKNGYYSDAIFNKTLCPYNYRLNNGSKVITEITPYKSPKSHIGYKQLIKEFKEKNNIK